MHRPRLYAESSRRRRFARATGENGRKRPEITAQSRFNPVSERRVVRSGLRNAQVLRAQSQPGQLARRFPAQEDPVADHEVDDRRHDFPIPPARLSFAYERRELGRIRVVAEVLQSEYMRSQFMDSCSGRAGMSAAFHEAQFAHALHQLRLIVVPGMERGDISREAGAGRIPLRVPESAKLCRSEGARFPQSRRRPIRSAISLCGNSYSMRSGSGWPGE